MNKLVELFMSGAIASLLSIIAALGIIINNNRAAARQKNDIRIKIKMDIIENVYNRYVEISNEYITIMSSITSRLYDIQDEIIYNGSDNEYHKYISELQELCKKVLFLATYKRKTMDAYKIEIDSDGMAICICDVLNNIVIYARAVAYISKLYVVEYYENRDFEITREKVIANLKDRVKKYSGDNQNIKAGETAKDTNCDYYKENAIRKFEEVIKTFDEREKSLISSQLKIIIKEYSKNIENTSLKEIDQFEEKLTLAIKKLV